MRSAGSAIALLLLFAVSAYGSEMRVSARRIPADESLSVTLYLDGSFADIDTVTLPLTNLVVDGRPSVESQYQWSNGRSFSRRNLRYTLRPKAAGAASIGEILLVAPDGSKQLLPRVDIEVVPEIGAAAGSPEEQLRQLTAANRERVVLAVEPSSTDPYIGQQVTLTWFLYTQESIRDVRLSGNPTTGDFWSEEIPIEDGEQFDVMFEGAPMKKVAVRRIALFPLRTGQLTVSPMELRISVMQPVDDRLGGFLRRNFSERDITRRSHPLKLNVKPVPGGVEQVGTYRLTCTPPVASPSGPIMFDVMLVGDGYLRAAGPPSLTGAFVGRADFSEGATRSRRIGDRLEFTRRWRAILFPQRAGRVTVPPVNFRYYDVATAAAAQLTCGGASLTVAASVAPTAEKTPPHRPRSPVSPLRIKLGLSLIATTMIIAWVVWARIRRTRLRMRRVEELFAPDQPTRELRRRVFDWTRERTRLVHDDLLLEASERGDSFRAVISVLDLRAATERERSTEIESELRERLAALVDAVSRRA